MEIFLSTHTEVAPEPSAPSVVENSRFSGFFFGDDLQEDGKWSHTDMTKPFDNNPKLAGWVSSEQKKNHEVPTPQRSRPLVLTPHQLPPSLW